VIRHNPLGPRFPVIWGRTADMGDHPDRLHCFACSHELPVRAAVQCGECAHAWRWGWLLSLRHVWLDVRRGPHLNDGWGTRAPWWRLDRWVALLPYVHPRRPSHIWTCPCCAHDL